MATSVAASLKLLLKCGNFLGIVPKYNEKTRSFQRTRIHSYIIIGVFLATYTYSKHGKRKMEIFTGTVIKQLFSNSSLLVITLLNILSIFGATSWNLKNYQEMFKNFDEVDEELMVVHRIDFSERNFVGAHFVFAHVFVIALTIYDIVLWKMDLESMGHIKYVVHEMVQMYYVSFMVLLQYFILKSIRQRFELINGIVGALQLSKMKIILNKFEGHRWTQKIDSIIKIHNTTCDIVNNFNDLFGWHILFTMLHILINISSTIEIVLNTKLVWYIYYKISMGLGMFYLIGHGVIVAVMCEEVSEEGRKVVDVSFKALNRNSFNAVIKDKLFLLASQANSRAPRFSAAGFFNVDYSILFNFLNLVTTYAIVIIQFSLTD